MAVGCGEDTVPHCSMSHRKRKAQCEQALPQGSGLFSEEGVHAVTLVLCQHTRMMTSACLVGETGGADVKWRYGWPCVPRGEMHAQDTFIKETTAASVAGSGVRLLSLTLGYHSSLHSFLTYFLDAELLM